MKITFVHIVEQIQFEPQTALLSSVAKFLGHEVSRVSTDFGTKQEILTAALQGEAPDLLAVRVTGEMREAVCWSIAELRRSAPTLPILLYGPLAEDDPGALAGVADPAFLLSDEAEQALVSLLCSGSLPTPVETYEPTPGVGVSVNGVVKWGAPLPLGDPEQAPPTDYDLFGAPAFFGRGSGCSFFGDVPSALLEVSIGSPSGMPGNAGLRIFNYPTNKAPRSRPMEAVLAMIDALPGEVRRVEFADREFGWMSEVAVLLRGLKERSEAREFVVRQLANTCDLDFLKQIATKGVKEVVFEYDVATPEAWERLPEGQDPARLDAAVQVAQGAGLRVGLLVSVGLPGESREEIDSKLERIRRWGVDRLRFIPFEPRIGHGWRQLCADAGMLPEGDGAWNRETYTPLSQTVIDEESWYLAWQDCLDLQAQVAMSV